MTDTYIIKNRKKTVSKNVIINVFSKIVSLLIGFVTRKLLLTLIVVEYLGLTSLFVNVLDLLNLAELGIGVALQVRLYKPLVNDDKDKVGNILALARKIYFSIAIVVIVAALITSSFLPFIIKENPFDDWYVRSAFLIASGGIALSYLCADKRLYFESNESLYIATLADIFSRLLTSAVALSVLWIGGEGVFLIYLAITYLATFIANLFMYILFKSRHKEKVVKDEEYQKGEFKEVKKNLKNVIPNKLSVFVFTSTDSIVITIFIGLAMVAIYSNYMTIMMAFLSMSAIASNGLVSTFGKMIKEGKDKEYIYDKFLKYEAMQFMFSSFTAICLFCLLDKFIIAWVGADYLLPFWAVSLLSFDYLVHSLFQPMSTLFTSTEKFKEDKLCSFISAGINIGTSLLLVYFFGVIGVILGTLISNVFTYIFRARLIYKSYFDKGLVKRLIIGLIQIALTVGLAFLVSLVVKLISFENPWVDFIISALVALVLSNVLNLVLVLFYIFKVKKMNPKQILKKLFPRTIKLIQNHRMKKHDKMVIGFNNNRKSLNHDKPRIVFISQCEHIFDKTKPVVEECIKKGFDVILYVVKDEVTTYEEKTIFEKEFPNLCVKYEDKKLKDLEADYVFYPRPYIAVLPKDIRPDVVTEYAKTCYIPYGYSLMDLGYVNLNRDFITCANFMFLDNAYAKNYAEEHMPEEFKKYNRMFDVGYPYFDSLLNNFDSFIKDGHDCFKGLDKQNKLNAIWAPRWTNDDALGGSNFLRYWKNFNTYFINNQFYNYVFRPHPYALDYYVKTGQISQEEKDAYLAEMNNSNNARYDNNSDYFATFNSSDVLICDVSSIIAEYVFLDKPVIFCHNEGKDILNSIAEEMCGVFYNAYSFEDIERYLTDLSKGIDPLKEKRTAYCKKYKAQFEGSVLRIVDIVEKDFKGE